jgi:hypothetical protein
MILITWPKVRVCVATLERVLLTLRAELVRVCASKGSHKLSPLDQVEGGHAAHVGLGGDLYG